MKNPPTQKLFYPDKVKTKLTTRDEIEERFKWNLNDVYESDDEWEKDFKWVAEQLKKYSLFKGKLSESAENLINCLNFDDEIGIKIDRLHLYSMLSKDSDMRVTKYQGMDDRIKSLYSNVLANSSFIKPEILSISESLLKEWIKENKELKVYEHAINDLLRSKEHTLDKDQEELLALTSEISQIPYGAYSIFTNADLKFPTIQDENGNNVEISHARYYAALYSPDRAYRERAFKAYLSVYGEFVNSFSQLFNGNLKVNIFHSRARKYNSALEASLDRNNIPVSVYENLVKAVNTNLQPMHRWTELKKKLLKVSEFHPWDTYVTLFDEKLERKYSYEEALKIVTDSLQVMGKDYLNSLDKAFKNRWIDVYETKGKRSGAYSSGTTFGVHPYVLLNWTDLLNDVFTLTHEMGHNMHSYYTGMDQPYPYANYSIFLAEVASTFNESLLLEHLIEASKTRDEKLHLLEKYLNNITTTFYRQVMFAEFEKLVYEKTENGEALTSDVLSELYKDIYQKYWGKHMVVDEEETFTWARVPHFYYNFYVYQYATGFAASEVLANKVKTEGNTAVEKYLTFLKSGSSDYPINILKKAGVDMNSPAPVVAVAEKMNLILDEMEELI